MPQNENEIRHLLFHFVLVFLTVSYKRRISKASENLTFYISVRVETMKIIQSKTPLILFNKAFLKFLPILRRHRRLHTFSFPTKIVR